MASYSVAEAKNRFTALLGAVERGEKVVITRRGTPVATLNAIQPPPRVPVAEALERLRRLRESLPQQDVDWVDAVREMREADHR
ncbi:MAG: type II toxin-antitoxin system prevent-host-death family antitoxin [Sphingomonadaceae bacterium]|nr:type II toxin-antitoxin system prevent-host-death family antitoxin [Sphingomonadaceae bacterium]